MTPTAAQTFFLTPGLGAVLLLCLLSPPLLLLVFRWKHKKLPGQAGTSPDWSIPTVDAQAQGSSLFHSWMPAAKIGSLLAVSFLIVTLHALVWSAVALAIALLNVHLARISWQRSIRRLTAVSGLCLLFIILLPLTSPPRPGDTLLIVPLLEGLPLRLAGVVLALTITCKAATVALLMEPMFATAELSRTLQGFTSLGLPPSLTQMILLCHRYLFVFQQEAARMQRSMRVRGFAPGTNLATLRTTGNGLGMLFIRSFERTERVYEAMLSRGYQGTFPALSREKITAGDLAKGAISIMIGVLLLVLDRLYPTLWL
jgi:cobalt/nickel transport system permease protein